MLPARPSVPALVDPDRFLDALDGRRFVRKVQRDTSVRIDTIRSYTTQAVVGKYVTLRVEAATRSFVIEHDGYELKRVPIVGTEYTSLIRANE